MDRYRSVDRYRGRARYSGPLCGKIAVQKRCEKIALWTAIAVDRYRGRAPYGVLHIISCINPLKVCHTKIDRMRSMDVCPLNFAVCRSMATKHPMKLPNAFLYTKLKSFGGVHILLLAKIGGQTPSFSYPRSRVSAQLALECLDYLDANEPFDFSDGDASGSGSDISYDGDLGDDSGDEENGAGDGEGPNVVDGDSDDDSLVVGRGVRGRGRGRGHRGGRCGGRGRGSGGGGRGRGHERGV